MRHISLIVLITTSFLIGSAQDIKTYVKESPATIRAIVPDSIDFSDLETLGVAIGDSRIVMLGEQDHGDAPTFLAKTRIIKYLHEKKGSMFEIRGALWV
jgi:erythromycin esterase-like protein